ncbi:bacillithiol biosynthesis cysteine-adding enzyme BshC [Brevibacillus laterosporus]|uniref:bacillithiol biosynthesis cysteine-adding enzyme BshC n=1 Tax=Brevibacillus laterosporus TaxID=1465 RepID=UPI000B9B4333|nr:bacillithiol biosynthesis cysteine-adding enzyme BshC [Brevibacillus laterosporus]
MKTTKCYVPTANSFQNDFQKESPKALSFFTYVPYDPKSYVTRMHYVSKQRYPHRNLLADALVSYNQEIGNHEAAFHMIEKLRESDSLVVVAGQQAGLFTGPLYTIYKAIDVIQLAKQTSAQLGVSVIPMFWIAGEDHDWEEINHFYQLTRTKEIRKVKVKAKHVKKHSATDMTVEQADMLRVIEDFFAEETETDYSETIRCCLEETAERSHTLVDWFAQLMARLFGAHGLVFIESSLPIVRQLERPVFEQIIRENKEMNEELLQAQADLREYGYPEQLDIQPQQANFFFYEQKERLLMERVEGGFQSKDGGKIYTQTELLSILQEAPERFSANVVTRPLMQEHLLPTLAFVGGPGEVAYWAYFKKYFASFGYELPIVLKRTSITLMEGALNKIKEQKGISYETLLSGFSDWKEKWLQSLDDHGFAQRFEQKKRELEMQYQDLLQDVTAYDKGLAQLAQKNVERLVQDVDFMQKRTEEAVLRKHQVEVERVQRLEQSVVPQGNWQERVYPIFTYLNRFGPDLVDRLVGIDFERDGSHQIVYL